MAKTCNCKKCHTNYDAFLSNCPLCNENNDTFPLDRRFSNILFLTDIKLVLLAFVGAIGIFAFNILFTLAFRNMPFDDSLKDTIVSFTTYVIVLSLLFCIINSDYKKLFPTFKKIKPIIVAAIGAGVAIGFSFAYSAILKAAGYNYVSSSYQTSSETMCRNLPALAFFSFVIVGPLCEELAYRVGFFGIIRKHNRFLAHLTVILIYSLVHLDFTQLGNVNEWINLPVYIVPSFILTMLYEYEGLSASLYAHALNNLISFILIFAVK